MIHMQNGVVKATVTIMYQCAGAHTHTYTHTPSHTPTHTYTHTYTYLHIHTHLHTPSHTPTPSHTHSSCDIILFSTLCFSTHYSVTILS